MTEQSALYNWSWWAPWRQWQYNHFHIIWIF